MEIRKLGIIFPRFPRFSRFPSFWFATFSLSFLFFFFFINVFSGFLFYICNYSSTLLVLHSFISLMKYSLNVLPKRKNSKIVILSIFLTKEGFNKYIKLLCGMKLWDKIRRCSVKKMFLEISQNLHKYTCVGVSFLTKLHVSYLKLC